MSAPHYLLDTALCVEIVRHRPRALLERAEHVRAGDAALSVLGWGLLQHAASSGRRRLAALPLLEEFAGLVPILPLPPEAASAYRELRMRSAAGARLAPGERPRASNHAVWLMAHARAAGLVLVTHDARRFPPAPGLRLECWSRR
ncbi:MAG: hypothetical protein U1F06_01260 [Steroidobacteraceae bacterium]